jgi:hypothetical protein
MRPNVFAVIFAAIEMRSNVFSVSLAAIFCIFAVMTPVLATPLTWDINVLYLDGTLVTGSFVFDADTTTFSDLAITTSGGSVIPSKSTWYFNTRSPLGEQNAGITTGIAVVDVASNSSDYTGAYSLSLFNTLSTHMTDAGGTISLNYLEGGRCISSTCNVYAFPSAEYTENGTGTFTANAATDVPEPLTASIFGLGIAGMIAVRRKSAPLSAIAALSNRGKIYGV